MLNKRRVMFVDFDYFLFGASLMVHATFVHLCMGIDPMVVNESQKLDDPLTPGVM